MPAYLPAPGNDGSRNRPHSERTARLIDSEVGALLDTAHARVGETLSAQRPVLEAIAHLLLEQEVVDRVALDALLAQHSGKSAPVVLTRPRTR